MYVLTKGNGAQYAIVILGNGRGPNLEDLAAGQINSQHLAQCIHSHHYFLPVGPVGTSPNHRGRVKE